MSKAGSKLIKSAKQALGYARGETSEGFVAHVPEEADVRSIRVALGLTQSEFSHRFGFDVVQFRTGNKNAVCLIVPHGYCCGLFPETLKPYKEHYRTKTDIVKGKCHRALHL